MNATLNSPEGAPVTELPYKTDLLAKQMAEKIGASLVNPKSLDDSIRRMVNTHDLLQDLADNQENALPFMEDVVNKTTLLLETDDNSLDQRDQFDSTEELVAHQSALSIKKALLQIEQQKPDESHGVRENVLATLNAVAKDKKLSADFVYKMALELEAVAEDYGNKRAEMF